MPNPTWSTGEGIHEPGKCVLLLIGRRKLPIILAPPVWITVPGREVAFPAFRRSESLKPLVFLCISDMRWYCWWLKSHHFFLGFHTSQVVVWDFWTINSTSEGGPPLINNHDISSGPNKKTSHHKITWCRWSRWRCYQVREFVDDIMGCHNVNASKNPTIEPPQECSWM